MLQVLLLLSVRFEYLPDQISGQLEQAVEDELCSSSLGLQQFYCGKASLLQIAQWPLLISNFSRYSELVEVGSVGVTVGTNKKLTSADESSFQNIHVSLLRLSNRS